MLVFPVLFIMQQITNIKIFDPYHIIIALYAIPR